MGEYELVSEALREASRAMQAAADAICRIELGKAREAEAEPKAASEPEPEEPQPPMPTYPPMPPYPPFPPFVVIGSGGGMTGAAQAHGGGGCGCGVHGGALHSQGAYSGSALGTGHAAPPPPQPAGAYPTRPAPPIVVSAPPPAVPVGPPVAAAVGVLPQLGLTGTPVGVVPPPAATSNPRGPIDSLLDLGQSIAESVTNPPPSEPIP